jgi:energy-coupling factor transporter ATP-binding protein EcfA2
MQLLRSIRIKNFKAVQDSRKIRLEPLSVFIGNNGAGKSSLIEALQAVECIVQNGVDRAMAPHHGFEHAWNKATSHAAFAPNKIYPPPAEFNRPQCMNPMAFDLSGSMTGRGQGPYRMLVEVTSEPGKGSDRVFIRHELFQSGKRQDMVRYPDGRVVISPSASWGLTRNKLDDGDSVFKDMGIAGIGRWQFLMLAPQNMGEPAAQQRAGGDIRLASDGRNIAQYLKWVKDQDGAAYDGIVESMRFVLNYARDLQPTLTSELERTVYLQMTERDFKIPGWLFSSGTLRILALLALLRSPKPPPLIVIEEVENGLDPRTVHMVVNEIRDAVHEGRTQVMMTTHSPYLLDLLPLQTVVLCQRNEKGVPMFWQPSKDEEVRAWAKEFSPGRLYTMGRYKREVKS